MHGSYFFDDFTVFSLRIMVLIKIYSGDHRRFIYNFLKNNVNSGKNPKSSKNVNAFIPSVQERKNNGRNRSSKILTCRQPEPFTNKFSEN